MINPEVALREWAQDDVDETVDCFLRFKKDDPSCFSCSSLGFCESLEAKLREIKEDASDNDECVG